MKVTKSLIALGLIGSIALSGCGGGTSGGGGSSAAVGVFLTDSFRDDYKQVWATIYKVELIDSTNVATTVFADTTGKTVNFSSLRDVTGARFAFLSQAAVPAGSYTKIKFTLSKNLSVVPTALNNAEMKELKGDTTTDPNQVVVIINLPAAKTFTSGDDFVIDFDLANFSFDGAKVVPSIKEGDKNGIDDSDRHEEDDIHGVISSLTGTAPNQTFDLNIGAFGKLIKVRTSSTTAVYNGDGTTNPVISVGKRVEVSGKFDTVTKELNATNVKIEDGNDIDEDPNQAHGNVVKNSVDKPEAMFTITVTRVDGFVSPGTGVAVKTTGNTKYRRHNGVSMTFDEFYDSIALADLPVEVEGTYDSETKVFTATKCKIEGEDDNGGGGGGGGGSDDDVEAKGTPSGINGTAGTFTMAVNEFEGWSFGGGSIEVTTVENTSYQNSNNDEMTKTAFFAALPGKQVKANGDIVNGKIQARRLRLLR